MACENPIEIAAPFQKLRHGPAISSNLPHSWQKSLECDASHMARAGWSWSAVRVSMQIKNGHLRVRIDPRHFQLRTASYEGEKRKKRDLVACLLPSFSAPSSKDGREGEAGLQIRPQKRTLREDYTKGFCPFCPSLLWCPSLPPSLSSPLVKRLF